MKSLVTFLVCIGLLLPGLVLAAGDDGYSDLSSEISRAAKLIKKEKYKSAIKQLKRAIARDKTDADAWNLLGFASRKSGDFETADEAYRQALAFKPNHKGALEYQGQLFISQGRLDAALENLQKLKSLCPSGCEELSSLQASLDAQ